MSNCRVAREMRDQSIEVGRWDQRPTSGVLEGGSDGPIVLAFLDFQGPLPGCAWTPAASFRLWRVDPKSLPRALFRSMCKAHCDAGWHRLPVILLDSAWLQRSPDSPAGLVRDSRPDPD